MENKSVLPGLEEAERSLNRLLLHSGGEYTEFDRGWKAGVKSSLEHVRMLINQSSDEE